MQVFAQMQGIKRHAGKRLTATGCLELMSLSDTLSCSACSAAVCWSSGSGRADSSRQYFFTR